MGGRRPQDAAESILRPLAFPCRYLNPLQCSCLENPRDGEAWWAAVYGVAQSRTRLKWLSSSSSMYLKGRSTALFTATCRPSSKRSRPSSKSHRPRTLTNLPKCTFDRLARFKGRALSAGSCAPWSPPPQTRAERPLPVELGPTTRNWWSSTGRWRGLHSVVTKAGRLSRGQTQPFWSASRTRSSQLQEGTKLKVRMPVRWRMELFLDQLNLVRLS